MLIKILDATESPIGVISRAAGNCYGKDDVSDKRVQHCITAGHWSVLEHAKATFRIEGISRSCSHQLVRHRLASYSQLSQRYKKIDPDLFDWYVIPPSFRTEKKIGKNTTLEWYKKKMASAGKAYAKALKEGMTAEDARFLLPEATKTDIVVTMNLREFMNFYILRSDKAAQWEIRDMANSMQMALRDYNAQWGMIMAMLENAR